MVCSAFLVCLAGLCASGRALARSPCAGVRAPTPGAVPGARARASAYAPAYA